jgi:hypothetical protein
VVSKRAGYAGRRNMRLFVLGYTRSMRTALAAESLFIGRFKTHEYSGLNRAKTRGCCLRTAWAAGDGTEDGWGQRGPSVPVVGLRYRQSMRLEAGDGAGDRWGLAHGQWDRSMGKAWHNGGVVMAQRRQSGSAWATVPVQSKLPCRGPALSWELAGVAESQPHHCGTMVGAAPAQSLHQAL